MPSLIALDEKTVVGGLSLPSYGRLLGFAERALALAASTDDARFRYPRHSWREQGGGMISSREDRRDRYVAKARAELESLASQGVLMTGNAFSSVLLLKGEPTEDERAGGRLLSGEDGDALRAALQALGYAPEDWAGLATWDEGGAPLSEGLLREAICALDPATLIVCDHAAADRIREVYASELLDARSEEQPVLADGKLTVVAGMRALSLGGFAAALASKHEKQVMWHRLKKLPPLGEPY